MEYTGGGCGGFSNDGQEPPAKRFKGGGDMTTQGGFAPQGGFEGGKGSSDPAARMEGGLIAEEGEVRFYPEHAQQWGSGGSGGSGGHMGGGSMGFSGMSSGGKGGYHMANGMGGPRQQMPGGRPNIVIGEVRFSQSSHAQTAIQQLNGSELGGKTVKVVLDGTDRANTRVLVLGLDESLPLPTLKHHFSRCGQVLFYGMKINGRPAHTYHEQRGENFAGQRNLPSVAGQGNQQFNNMQQHGMQQHGMQQQGMHAMQQQGMQQQGMQQQGVLYDVHPGDSGVHSGTTLPQAGLQIGEVRFADPEHAKLAIQHCNGLQFGSTTITVRQDGISRDASGVLVMGLAANVTSSDLSNYFGQLGTVTHAAVRPNSTLAVT